MSYSEQLYTDLVSTTLRNRISLTGFTASQIEQAVPIVVREIKRKAPTSSAELLDAAASAISNYERGLLNAYKWADCA